MSGVAVHAEVAQCSKDLRVTSEQPGNQHCHQREDDTEQRDEYRHARAARV